MKRIVMFVLTMGLMLGLVGCGEKRYEAAWDEPFCVGIAFSQEESPKGVEIGAGDKRDILEIMNEADWIDEMTNCGCDFVFYTKYAEVRYHSACGTFVDYTGKRAAILSEEECDRLSAILGIERRNVVS